jgi:hypothetical protein
MADKEQQPILPNSITEIEDGVQSINKQPLSKDNSHQIWTGFYSGRRGWKLFFFVLCTS